MSFMSSRKEILITGKYRVVRRIGGGSFGDIYLAINIANGEVSKWLIFPFDNRPRWIHCSPSIARRFLYLQCKGRGGCYVGMTYLVACEMVLIFVSLGHAWTVGVSIRGSINKTCFLGFFKQCLHASLPYLLTLLCHEIKFYVNM